MPCGIRVGAWSALVLILGCGSPDAKRTADFNANDLPQTLMWLRDAYEPAITRPAAEQNPLAKKEAVDTEQAKFAERVQSIKGTSVRWSLGVEKLTVDGFRPVWAVQQKSERGTVTGRIKLYREAKPKVETVGLIFKETVDHAIARFEVPRDIAPDLYKQLTATGQVVLEGKVHDIHGFSMGSDAIFDIVLVEVKIVGVLP